MSDYLIEMNNLENYAMKMTTLDDCFGMFLFHKSLNIE